MQNYIRAKSDHSLCNDACFPRKACVLEGKSNGIGTQWQFDSSLYSTSLSATKGMGDIIYTKNQREWAWEKNVPV